MHVYTKIHCVDMGGGRSIFKVGGDGVTGGTCISTSSELTNESEN